MFANQSRAIYEVLRERQLIAPERLAAANDEAKATGTPLADALLAHGLIGKPALLANVADHCGCEFLSDAPATLPSDTVATLPANLARRHGVIPWRVHDRHLDLLAQDPFNEQTAGDLAFALGRNVRLVVADPDCVETLIERYYGEKAVSGGERKREIETAEDERDRRNLVR